MRKSLGSKRKELSQENIETIVSLYGNFQANEYSKIYKAKDFGYTTITVERPLRDGHGQIVMGRNNQPKPDSSLRDTENVPLTEDIDKFFETEVKPNAPDAWIDKKKSKIGYEIPFSKCFYVFKPPRSLSEIDIELKESTDNILKMIRDLSA